METRSAAVSVSVHAAVLAFLLLLAVGTAPTAKLSFQDQTRRAMKLAPYRPAAPGGAANDHRPTSEGHLPPRVESRIFVPPQVLVPNPSPRLVMTAAMDVPPSLDHETGPVGDPTGLAHLLSGGIGGLGGIGDGSGGKTGPGSGGGGPTYRSGRGGVSAPIPIHKVEPEYSEAARKARTMGSVLVLVDVGADGRVHNIRVARGIGLGLDEKAVEAVSQWLFRPGMKEGKPVTVAAQIEVAFHLL